MSHDAIRSQYQATLSMLQQAVDDCPPALWNRSEDKNKYWQVAYHALFYIHLYLQPTLQDFVPWTGHKPDSERWNHAFDHVDHEQDGKELYTKEDVLTYLNYCRQQVDSIVPTLDLDAESGFHWLPMSKLELQFYSLRHVHSHIGELAERLWVVAGSEVDWVAKET